MSDLAGFIIVNKPAGVTSHDVVAFVRRRLKTKKVGHAGTLDPMATGVLILGIGQGTHLLEYLVGCDKEYEAELTFGAESDTYDAEGELYELAHPVQFSRADFEHLFPRFTGKISQIPPKYSAIKIGGRSAYELARSGKELEMQARPVEIYSLRTTKFVYPKAGLHVHCGSGTYIRSLAHDLGQSLNNAAYLSRLTRTRAGRFEIGQAVNFHHIRVENMLPLAVGVAHLPSQNLTKVEVEKIRHGQKISARDCYKSELRAGFFEGELVAVLRCEPEKGVLAPEKVIATE